METFVALCSLKQALECLEDSAVISSSFSSGGGIMDVLEKSVGGFDPFGIGNDSSQQIRDAILEMEDVIESYISGKFLSSQSEDVPVQRPSFIVDLDEIRRHVDSFAATIREILIADSARSNDGGDGDDLRSRVDFVGGSLNDQYFGLSDQFEYIKGLLQHKLDLGHQVFCLLSGMAGIGKTALAKKLFRDPDISSLFSKRAFVTVGQKYQLERVLEDIQKQLMDDPEVDGGNMLLVLDDLWDNELCLDLFYSQRIWPTRAVTVLLFSRLTDIKADFKISLRLMDKKESWDLLRHKLFDKTPCPPQLEKAGRKIAEKCQGLPLTIVTVADIMSKADEMTSEEFWNKVATEKRSSIFMEAYDQMFEVLYRSYNHLNCTRKPGLLYLAAFPQNDEIPYFKFINLLLVEGFLGDDYLFDELVRNSMIIVRKKNFVVKTCSLHSSFWHMCNKEAGKIKLFLGVDSPDDLAEEDVKSHRRLCIRDNTVLAFKDVYNSMASISKLRSLMCTGPYHQYPVPIHLCLEYFRLLRILNALSIRFYEFPLEVLMKLFHLRYLSLTCDGNLPASIFKLYNLHYLIVHRHHSIREAVGKTSYLPMEIWFMKELKYLHVMGGNLPGPPIEGRLLQKLQILLEVGPQTCTKDVFERIPNLTKLGIRIELAPDSNDESLCFFDHISHLRKLRRLKCTIVNPKIMSPPPPLPIFPECLEKLTLSGFGYPWEDMCKIAQLPNLEVLKLECYAFRGPKWELKADDFPCLEYLMIEDSDLVELTFKDESCLPKLQLLSIKHCYKLQKIPLKLHYPLREIELVECNTVALASANKTKEDYDQYNHGSLVLNVHSTWDI